MVQVRVGRGGWTRDANAAEKQFQTVLLKAVKTQAIRASRPTVEKIGALVQDVATAEAHKLFEVIADRIDNPGRALTGADLAEGMNTAGVVTGGRLTWAPLSRPYYNRKWREARPNADKMFHFRGYLSGYFRRSGISIVDNRFGGVNVKIDADDLAAGRTALSYGGEDDPESLKEFLVGHLNITIFPLLTESLMPGLASRRWEQTLQDPEFEASVFGGLRTAAKLMQHHGDRYVYRPLVLPAVQFWILVRLPAVIREALRKQLNRVQLKSYLS